jgi:hypothetical protein
MDKAILIIITFIALCFLLGFIIQLLIWATEDD